jgi:hypothetical protein
MLFASLLSVEDHTKVDAAAPPPPPATATIEIEPHIFKLCLVLSAPGSQLAMNNDDRLRDSPAHDHAVVV